MHFRDELVRRCFVLAAEAARGGNEPFGALLERDGRVLLEASNTVGASGDLTAHAELELLRRGARELGREAIEGSVLYTSAEPCAMCTGALYWAGVAGVVFACSGATLERLSGCHFTIPCREILERGERPVWVVGPVLEDEAIPLYDGFWS